MTSSATAVADAHHWRSINDDACSCGRRFATWPDFSRHVAEEALTLSQGAPSCNCLVVWDGVREVHVWISGTLDGSCGHPPTGTPFGQEATGGER